MSLLLILLVLYTIPQLIVFWKLYKIAGKPGWFAIVPVYGTVVMAEIAKKSIVLGLIGGLFEVFVYLRIVIDNPILGIGRFITVVFALYVLNAFIKQYNRGLGYWALVIFLPIIAVFTTDKSEYKGGMGINMNAQPIPGQPTDIQPNASALSVTPPTKTLVPPTVLPSSPVQDPTDPETSNQPPKQV